MPNVTIQLSDQRTAFAPRETVTGQVSWQGEAPPQSAELRLFWSTRGRGIEDIGIVETIPFPSPQATESRRFTVTLPEAPYSFSGTLITLTWSLEIVLQPGNRSDGVEITLAPGGEAVSLPRVTTG